MTENEAIKKHIEECKHRIETIQGYVKRSEDANKKECEINIYILESTIQALEENQQYHEIGTVEECQEAMEKAEPKKPIRNDLCTCPSCGTHNEVIKKRRNTVVRDTVYCWHCGQAIECQRDIDLD